MHSQYVAIEQWPAPPRHTHCGKHAQCAYRPLVGNGLNRDTAVYVGVQTLENSGVDRRVDLIQTEAGMEWRMPEAHAVWK